MNNEAKFIEALTHLRNLYAEPVGETPEEKEEYRVERRVGIETLMGIIDTRRVFYYLDNPHDLPILRDVREEMRAELEGFEIELREGIKRTGKIDPDVWQKMDDMLSSDLWCSRFLPSGVEPTDEERVRAEKAIRESYPMPLSSLSRFGYRSPDSPVGQVLREKGFL